MTWRVVLYRVLVGVVQRMEVTLVLVAKAIVAVEHLVSHTLELTPLNAAGLRLHKQSVVARQR